jgi:amino acid adenylation domain-containing protein
MTNLFDAIAGAAAAHGSRPAVWAGGDTLSYDALMDLAARTATALLESGVRPGDRVAILTARSLAAYVGVVAALRAGCVYVPLNKRFPAARNRTMLELSGATALIIDGDGCRRFADLVTEPPQMLRTVVTLDPAADPRCAARLTYLDHRTIGATRPRTAWLDRTAADDCYLIFTSGSTGEPKGVPITHGNVLAYLAGISEITPVTHDDRLIQLCDLSFDVSAHSIFLALTSGAALYSIPDHANLLGPRFVSELELTCWCSVPSVAGLARREGLLEPGSLPSLRISQFAGEALHGTVAAAWAAAAPSSAIYNLYGPTEATITVSWHRYRPEDAAAFVPIGRPFRGQQLEVFGPDDEPLPDGEVGELLLAGSQLTRGYWNGAALDAEKFKTIAGTRWYRTGDLARRSAGDGFHYAGRIDHQTKILGFRVELLEIESALRTITGRDALAVIAWPVTIDGGAQGTVGFVAGPAVDEDATLAALRALLPAYMVPSRLIAVDALPLNANGKTDYTALRWHPALS